MTTRPSAPEDGRLLPRTTISISIGDSASTDQLRHRSRRIQRIAEVWSLLEESYRLSALSSALSQQRELEAEGLHDAYLRERSFQAIGSTDQAGA